MELCAGTLIFNEVDNMYGVRFDQVPEGFVGLVIGEVQHLYDEVVKTGLEPQKAEMCRLLIQVGDDPEWARNFVESRTITSRQESHLYGLLQQLHLIERDNTLG